MRTRGGINVPAASGPAPILSVSVRLEADASRLHRHICSQPSARVHGIGPSGSEGGIALALLLGRRLEVARGRHRGSPHEGAARAGEVAVGAVGVIRCLLLLPGGAVPTATEDREDGFAEAAFPVRGGDEGPLPGW